LFKEMNNKKKLNKNNTTKGEIFESDKLLAKFK
jgi:hypothetical protein